MKCCSTLKKGFFSEFPDPVLQVLPPNTPPLPNQRLVGYYIYPSPSSCIVPPFERPMNVFGYTSIFLLAIVFWPLSCLPCCCGYSYDGYQIPVYE